MCELCSCWAMGLKIGPMCRRWRGCAEVAKTTCSKPSGHYGKTKRTPLSENSAKLIRRVFLSSDVQFICVDLYLFTSWLRKWSFFIQILKADYLWSRPSLSSAQGDVCLGTRRRVPSRLLEDQFGSIIESERAR